MKRSLSSFLVLFIALCLFAFTVQASDGAVITVSASKTAVNVGEEVNFTVNLKNAGRISSVAFLVKYDKEVFALVGSEMPKKTKDYFYDSDGDGKSDGVSSLFVPLDEYGTCGILLMPREKSGTREWFMSSADDLDMITFRLKAKKTAETSSVSVSVISLVSANEDASQNAEIPVPAAPDTVLSVVCEHTFGAWETADGTQHQRICSVCGERSFAHHQWDEGEQTKAPTCKDTGEKTYACTVCGHIQKNTVERTDAHEWDSGTITVHPTCKDEGEKLYRCKVCEKTETETLARMEEHSWELSKIINQPTCSANGTALYVCSICNASQTVILEATGDCNYTSLYQYDKNFHWYECLTCGSKKNLQPHIRDGGVLTEPATHTAVGKKLRTCIVCGMTEQEVLPLLAEHSYAEWKTHDDLLHSRVCECGDVQYEAHCFDVWTVIKEASEEEAGIEQSVCSDCGFVSERLIESIRESSSPFWQTSETSSAPQNTETAASSETTPLTVSVRSAVPFAVMAAVLAAGTVILIVVLKKKKRADETDNFL